VILIVDDHGETRRLLLYLLKTIGRRGVAVESGYAAMAYLGANDHVSCVILDFRMPGMSGLEVVRAIREDPRLRHLFVLMYSADDGETEQLCLAAGANAFVQKMTCDWVELGRTIEAHCGEPDVEPPGPESEVEGAKGRSAG
jgi:two-component system chemotaxis response regulator CheY